MATKILFRKSLAEEGECEVAKRYFDVIESRSLIQPGDFIICRYSALPYYQELEQDIKNLGAKLVNSYMDHQFVADLATWYPFLHDLTPKTWFSLAEAIADPYEGPYVLKGNTNSRKSLWKTHMFAQNKDEMRQVYFRLQDDGLIGDQGIVIRQFERFRNYGEAISGMPITKEFRFFVFNDTVVAHDFYWSSHPEVVEAHKPDSNEVPRSFINEVLWRVGDKMNFYVFDVAQREDGEWRVVELNDGQMSGLSCIDPDRFYNNLAHASAQVL